MVKEIFGCLGVLKGWSFPKGKDYTVGKVQEVQDSTAIKVIESVNDCFKKETKGKGVKERDRGTQGKTPNPIPGN